MAEVVQGRFDDFDELAAAARGWDLVLSKLDRNAFAGEILQLVDDGFILSRGRFSGHLRQEGSPPPGLRTMTVHVARTMSQYWRGRRVTGDDLMIFPRGSEVDTVSDPRFDIFTISFDEEALLDRADLMGCPRVRGLLARAEVVRCDPRGLERMRRVLVRSVGRIGVETAAVQQLGAEIQTEVVRLLDGACRAGEPDSRAVRRVQVFRDVQRHLARHPGQPVSVRELSRVGGVSVRTLQYAVRQQVGMGPKAYVNALRLNAARKDLRRAELGSICVSDVANEHGFWHLGQFAADYRRLFGENPSVTLGRLRHTSAR